MQKYDIHVCLVSGQAAPNLLPILDTEFKPKEIVLIVSNKMKEKANNLTEIYKKNNIKVTQKMLSDEFNFSTMEQEIYAIAEEYLDKNVALNVTGGTKLIAIAAQNAFQTAGNPIFYVDTDENRIIFISKDEQGHWIEDKMLQTNVNLSDYFGSYGFQTFCHSQPDIKEEWLDIPKLLIQYYDRYANVIPLLNKYASLAEKQGLKVEISKEDQRINLLDDVLAEFDDKYDLIEYRNNQINFKNQDVRFFLNGGWLEDYTFNLLKDIKQIDDIGCNIEVANLHYKQEKSDFSKNNQGNKNEFDIVFMAKNKLHIIECKTQKLDKSGGVKAEDILYKLETLKDYGGLFTKKCLISYCSLPEAILNRAKSLNIKIIQGKDLLRLKSLIQDWIAR